MQRAIVIVALLSGRAHAEVIGFAMRMTNRDQLEVGGGHSTSNWEVHSRYHLLDGVTVGGRAHEYDGFEGELGGRLARGKMLVMKQKVVRTDLWLRAGGANEHAFVAGAWRVYPVDWLAIDLGVRSTWRREESDIVLRATTAVAAERYGWATEIGLTASLMLGRQVRECVPIRR